MARGLRGPARFARRLLAAGAAALLGTIVVSGQAGAAPSAAVPPLGGVNVIGLYDGSTLGIADRDIARARALGAKVVRAELKWSALEPRRAGQIDPGALAFTDRLINNAAAAGIRVILTVDSTPCWASSAPAPLLGRCHPGERTAANAWPPTSTAFYGAVTSFLAARYGTRLAGIEIWNEPDHSNELYFAGPNKAERYAALLRAAYTAIKQANPAVTVLGGSLVGANGLFLRALYRQGIKGYYDGLAVHFYSLELASLRAFHEVQLANGDGAPLWLDEFGWSSCYPAKRLQEEQACVTPQVQGQNISDIVRSVSRTAFLAAAVVYNMQNSPPESFGLLASNGRPKPAFAALRRALASPFASAHRVTLSLRRHGSHVVARGAGPVGDYMQLEVFRRGVLRYRVLFTLNRFNGYAITLPAVLGRHGLRVRVFQYWAGLGRAATKSI